MALISSADLRYKDYRWTAISSNDDPRVTGKPDSTLLNRHEGYEVLHFLNRISKDKAGALKGERLIRNHLPGEVRSHANVLKWLIDNWTRYN